MNLLRYLPSRRRQTIQMPKMSLNNQAEHFEKCFLVAVLLLLVGSTRECSMQGEVSAIILEGLMGVHADALIDALKLDSFASMTRGSQEQPVHVKRARAIDGNQLLR